jgi:hypothetical protein
MDFVVMRTHNGSTDVPRVLLSHDLEQHSFAPAVKLPVEDPLPGAKDFDEPSGRASGRGLSRAAEAAVGHDDDRCALRPVICEAQPACAARFRSASALSLRVPSRA